VSSDASLLEAVVAARRLVVLSYGPDGRVERSIGDLADALAARPDVAAFVAQAAAGADVTADVVVSGTILELSVQPSAEGVIVVGRDQTQERLTQGRLTARAVRTMSLAELGRRTAEAGDDLAAVLTVVVETAVGELAPSAAIRLLDEQGRWGGLRADHHVDPEARSLQMHVLAATPEPARGTVAQSLIRGEPIFGPGLTEERVRSLVPPELWDLAGRWPLRTIAAVPLQSRGRLLGALILTRHDDDRWTEDDRAWAGVLADRAALAIDNAQLLHRISRRAEREAALARLGVDALSGMPVGRLVDEVGQVVVDALGIELVGAAAGQPGADELVLLGGTGWHPGLVGAARIPVGPGTLAHHTLHAGQPTVIDDFATSDLPPPSRQVADHDVRSGAVVVMALDEQRYGTLGAFSTEPRQWSEDEIHFLQSVAHVVATALERDAAAAATARALDAERLAALGQLAAGVAHDVNNIVAVVGVYAELLESQPGLDEEGRRQVAAIREQTRHAVGLVWQVLDVAHRSKLVLQELDPPRFVADMARVVADTAPPGIRVSAHAEADVPSVKADAGALHQVLLNLTGNAIDAMPAGGELTLSVEACADGGVRLAVRDTGVGMPVDVRARATEPFFTTKPSGSGTGLGLAQATGLVNQHGGRLEIDSEPGGGTTVSVWLPA
jgi:signal transduction histidine kinase